jgi:hypothetical protein
MSAVIKTVTPFTEQLVLIEALEALGAEPVLITNEEQLNRYRHRQLFQIGDIVTNRDDYFGAQHFRREHGSWNLRHDSDQMSGRVVSRIGNRHYAPVVSFLSELEVEYRCAYDLYVERLAEEERQKLERERVARVEATREQAIRKAREQGYSIKETRIKGKIQLVLTRST